MSEGWQTALVFAPIALPVLWMFGTVVVGAIRYDGPRTYGMTALQRVVVVVGWLTMPFWLLGIGHVLKFVRQIWGA